MKKSKLSNNYIHLIPSRPIYELEEIYEPINYYMHVLLTKVLDSHVEYYASRNI